MQQIKSKKGDNAMPFKKFRAWMAENKVTMKELAKLLGKRPETISHKLSGRYSFTWSEIEIICSEYGISADLFLR
jgi:antitoxin component HigA of HigAB toxin-antitoxin module